MKGLLLIGLFFLFFACQGPAGKDGESGPSGETGGLGPTGIGETGPQGATGAIEPGRPFIDSITLDNTHPIRLGFNYLLTVNAHSLDDPSGDSFDYLILGEGGQFLQQDIHDKTIEFSPTEPGRFSISAIVSSGYATAMASLSIDIYLAWNQLGPNPEGFSDGEADATSLFFDNGTPYVGYIDNNCGEKLTLMFYNQGA